MLATIHNPEHAHQINIIKGLLGTKYLLDSYDPKKGLDCWSCTKILQKEAFGRDLPTFEAGSSNIATFVRAIASNEGLVDWQQVEEPVHGCIVEMSTKIAPHHIGTYIKLPEYKLNGLVHCLLGAGVVYDPMITLKAAGWRRFTYNVPR